MSHKAIIIVPFLIGYFVIRIIMLIVCIFDDHTVDFHNNSDYVWASVISVTMGMACVFAYLFFNYFGII